jgi:hypothetical protein
MCAGLGLGKFLTQQHGAVANHGNQEQTHLYLPFYRRDAGTPGHKIRGQAAQDHTARPASMEDIQILRLIMLKERRDQWIGHTFAKAIADRKEKHSRGQAMKSGRFSAGRKSRSRGQGHNCGGKVQQECADHQRSVADLIRDQAGKDNNDPKTRQSPAGDLSQFGHGETILMGPLPENTATNAEANAFGKNGHETRPQKTFGVNTGTARRQARVVGDWPGDGVTHILLLGRAKSNRFET